MNGSPLDTTTVAFYLSAVPKGHRKRREVATIDHDIARDCQRRR